MGFLANCTLNRRLSENKVNHDEKSHFENDTEDVLKLFKKITGKEINFKNPPQDKLDDN